MARDTLLILLDIGLPRCGLPPVRAYVHNIPQAAIAANREVGVSINGIDAEPRAGSPDAFAAAAMALSQGEPVRMFMQEASQAVADEAAREHLAIQSTLEANLEVTDLFLGQLKQVIDRVRKNLQDGGNPFKVPDQITITYLAQLASVGEELSKTAIRLVDASQKMRGERGLDPSNRITNAIAIVTSQFTPEQLRQVIQTRSLPTTLVVRNEAVTVVEDEDTGEKVEVLSGSNGHGRTFPVDMGGK